MDEADAASLSLVVNVSCTSACTDEDEDDSDLLSSSTLTLTEEELGVREGEDEEEERLSGASSGEDDEEEMEGSYVLGLEYMKRELQSWIRPPRSSASFKTEAGLRDELQCGPNLSSGLTSSSSQNLKPSESSEPGRGEREEEEERRNAARRYMSQLVDDVENGNVDHSCLKDKDEDAELLREEASVFTKKGDVKTESPKRLPLELRPFLSKRASSLVGQLKGELPCHGASPPSPPSLSPVEDRRSHDALRCGRKSITSQETFKFSSFVTEETRRQLRDKDSSLPPKRRRSPLLSCCAHPPPDSAPLPPGGTENVHDFVMEIIDMTTVMLKNKDDQETRPLAQIRDKVLGHSHRPLPLRTGDFYTYLSLSSHDSDCGEVVQRPEDKSSTPAPQAATSPGAKSGALDAPSVPQSPDVRDEETLFAACTEQVYLGPPLCYSMALSNTKPRLLEQDHLSGSDPSLLSAQEADFLFRRHEAPGRSFEELRPLPPRFLP